MKATPKYKNLNIVIFLGLLSQSACIFATELMSSADAMDSGSWAVSVYGKEVKAKAELKISGVGAIQIPTSGGTSTIFSESNATVKLSEEAGLSVMVLTFRPRDGMHYQVKVGQVREFALEFSSGSNTNNLESSVEGLVYGFGFRQNLTQGTIVSAAVALDLSYTRTIVNFDRFQSGSFTSSIDERFEQDEFQAAVNVSRRWKQFEPFGGLKVNRLVSTLKDRVTKERVSGTVDGVSPFMGLKFNLFDRESLVVEASFVDDRSLSAGFHVQF